MPKIKQFNFKKLDLNIIDHKATTIFCLKFTLSALIVYSFEHYFKWPNGYWAIISVAAVSRPSIEQTYVKGLMRILGTLTGGFLAYLLMLIANDNVLVITIGLFIISTLSGLIILNKGIISYAGVVMGLTTIIIISESLNIGQYGTIFIERTGLVIFGIITAYTISIFINLLFKREKLSFRFIATSQHARYGLINKNRLRSSLPIALLLATIVLITYTPWLIWQTLGGFWAAITCFFIIEERILGVISKGKIRFTSHVCAAILGLVGVLFSFIFPPLQLITLCLGYIISGYIMVNANNLSHAGNTFAIAITIMLLYGPGKIITMEIILSRFFYVLIGISVGFLANKIISNFIQNSE